jgi:hypothetical protein
MAEEETPAAPVEETPKTETDPELAAILKDAQNPDAVKNAIDRQKADAKAARDEAAALKAKLQEIEDRDKTEQQKKDEAAQAAESRAVTAEAKALRFEVAAAKGVPLTQAHRLQGNTKAELEADADEFLKDVKQGSGGQLDGGARGSADTPKDMDAMIREAAGYR